MVNKKNSDDGTKKEIQPPELKTEDMPHIISDHSDVLMHMIIRLKDGSVAENTKRTGRPSKVQLGNQSISDAFEDQLIGLKVGDQKKFTLKAMEAFGAQQPANILALPRVKFDKSIELEPGVMVEFENQLGQLLIGAIKEINEDQVMVDFNHPLAGQDLNFEIEILSIDEKNHEVRKKD